jgi:SWI/SNF-related matrix-associated actin-dependent regulator 1 of chromatin subfamily A
MSTKPPNHPIIYSFTPSLITDYSLLSFHIFCVFAAGASLHPSDLKNELNKKERSGSGRFKFLIVSYNLIQRVGELLEKLNIQVIIADECHYLKNPKAKRTKLLSPLLKSAKRAILLSGTPALSRPVELWTQLNALDPKTWPDLKAFGRRYCRNRPNRGAGAAAGRDGFGSEFKGASNTKELHVLLTNSVMVRRLKKDILTQLPRKVRRVVKVDIEDFGVREELR